MLQLDNTTPRYFYKKADKLKSRKAIDEIFGRGKSISHFPLKIIWLTHKREITLQAGVGVSSRNFKKAVDRNRVKRLLREAYRLQKHDLQEYLENSKKSMSVFFLYVGKELPDYNTIHEKMGSAITRLIKWSNDNPEKNS